MHKQELIHSHILVAMLCGWEPRKPSKLHPDGYMELEVEGQTLPEIVANDDILEQLPYSTDWNYFMAAWDTFEENQVVIGEDCTEELDTIRNNIVQAILCCDLELAFKEMVRGVNTINQLKLQET